MIIEENRFDSGNKLLMALFAFSLLLILSATGSIALTVNEADSGVIISQGTNQSSNNYYNNVSIFSNVSGQGITYHLPYWNDTHSLNSTSAFYNPSSRVLNLNGMSLQSEDIPLTHRIVLINGTMNFYKPSYVPILTNSLYINADGNLELSGNNIFNMPGIDLNINNAAINSAFIKNLFSNYSEVFGTMSVYSTRCLGDQYSCTDVQNDFVCNELPGCSYNYGEGYCTGAYGSCSILNSLVCNDFETYEYDAGNCAWQEGNITSFKSIYVDSLLHLNGTAWNFSDGADNSSWNQSYANTLYSSHSNLNNNISALSNSTIARIGNCPTGQVVINTTTNGVQCIAQSSENSSWNQSLASTLYSPISEPKAYNGTLLTTYGNGTNLTGIAKGNNMSIQYMLNGLLSGDNNFTWRPTCNISNCIGGQLNINGGYLSNNGFTIWKQNQGSGHYMMHIFWAGGSGSLDFGDGSSSAYPLFSYATSGGTLVVGSGLGYGAYLGGTIRQTTTGLGLFGQSGEMITLDNGQIHMDNLPHEDPYDYGALWVDDGDGYTIKQSQG
jgi:hypothetical protein